MIGYLKGKIQSKTEKILVIEINGVGYSVFTTSTFIQQSKINSTTELYTHLDFNERSGSLELYGLPKAEEIDLFKKMISVSGVGPKSALGVFEVAKFEDIKKAIGHGDASLLTKVSGIGKKTAELIIIKLKGKEIEALTSETGISSQGEAIDALINFGYSASAAREALAQLPPEITTTEEKIKAALKLLSK